MNIVLYILIIILFAACSTARPRQNRMYDSTVILKDSLTMRAYKRTDGGLDTVRYHKQEYSFTHSAGWRGKHSWPAVIVAVMAAIIIIILKAKS